MTKVTVRYLIPKHYKGKSYLYWQPKPKYCIAGEWLKCPLPAQPVKSVSEAERLNEALDNWRSGVESDLYCIHGSFGWLIGEYKKSDWFKDLGKRTAKEYGYILEAIKETLKSRAIADCMAKDFSRQSARALYHLFRETPRKAQLVANISRIVFNYGEEIGEIEEGKNPFTKLRIRKRRARSVIWIDPEHENPLHLIFTMQDRAIEMGYPSIALGIDIGLWTTQREGDILKLTWGLYDGTTIKTRQSKTGTWVDVPVMPQLKEAMDDCTRTSTVVLLNEKTGKSYTKDSFGDTFREIRKAAGIPDHYQFRDLRKTGIVMLAMAGCTDTEITSISGHTNSEVSDILEVYLPRNSAMARNAIAKMKIAFSSKSRKKS